MFGMGHWEILIIFVVILLIFGAKRIPEMAQGLGKGIREFRTAMRDVQEEIDNGEIEVEPYEAEREEEIA
jgi:sec-independent protein translocase protein TatA